MPRIPPLAIAILVVLTASWGYQQVAIKVALVDFAPSLQAAIRSFGSMAIIGLFILLRLRKTPWYRGVLVPGIVAGLLFGFEFWLIFLSLTYTDAARVAVFIYTAPFWVALGSHLLVPGEKLGFLQWGGIALAFAGIVAAVGPGQSAGGTTLIGDLMAIGAGFLWGATTVTIKATNLKKAPSEQVLFYQLAVSAGLLAVLVLVTGDRASPPIAWTSWAMIAYQTIWVVSVSYAVWFWMISRYSATQLSVYTFLTPLLGTAFGVIFLNETVGLGHAIGLVLIIAGIVLVNRPAKVTKQANA